MQNTVRWHSNQFQTTNIWNHWSNKTDANLEESACTVRLLLFFPIFRLPPFKIFLRNNKSAINSTHDVHKVKCKETDSWCSKILPKVLKGRGDFQGATAHDFHLIFFFDMGGSMRATNFFDGLFSWLVAAVVLSKVNLCWKKNKLMVFQEISNWILRL